MTNRNRRRADRVEVGFPAQIYTHRGFLDAKLCDLSRTGLRMRVSIADLRMSPDSRPEEAVAKLAETLAPQFALDLDYKRFGPLLQRGVALTRIRLVGDASESVEVCCEFDEELGEDTLAILEQDLPPMREAAEDWEPETTGEGPYEGTVTMRPKGALEEAPVQLPTAAAPKKPAVPPMRHRYRALVTGTSPDAPPAFFCHTDLVTAVGVRVRIPRPKDAVDIRNAMSKLIKAHGTSVDVRILDESIDVWKGQARVTGVELPPDRLDVMLVTLAYERPLSMQVMRRLGLVSAA